jgi:hypothetical protein
MCLNKLINERKNNLKRYGVSSCRKKTNNNEKKIIIDSSEKDEN